MKISFKFYVMNRFRPKDDVKVHDSAIYLQCIFVIAIF